MRSAEESSSPTDSRNAAPSGFHADSVCWLNLAAKSSGSVNSDTTTLGTTKIIEQEIWSDLTSNRAYRLRNNESESEHNY
jgi:hypothetical protein